MVMSVSSEGVSVPFCLALCASLFLDPILDLDATLPYLSTNTKKNMYKN